MPFPMTHLCIAEYILSLHTPYSEDDAAAFMLGHLAPDAVHYRPGFTGADKKITHLCPVNDERWGAISDNEAWITRVIDFYHTHAPQRDNPFLRGYCAHILEDIFNNIQIWSPFRLAHPEEAARGYGSAYHREWGAIDRKLYQDRGDSRIMPLLVQAYGVDMPGLVTAEEIDAIRDNVLYVSYQDEPKADTADNRFVSYERVTRFVAEAALFASQHLPD